MVAEDGLSWPELIGKVLVTTTVQLSLGSLELPSRLLIYNTATSQEAADFIIGEFHTYMLIGGLWTVGTSILLYLSHLHIGALLNSLFNISAMAWIIHRRYSALVANAKKYNFTVRNLFW